MVTIQPMAHVDSKIVARIGKNTTIAKECGITPQAISNWKKRGIPKARIKYLMLVFPHAFNDMNNIVVDDMIKNYGKKDD